MAGVIADLKACVPALRRYAAALLGDPSEADELVHDCLLRALDRLHAPRNDAALRVHVFAILHGLAVNRTRRAKPRGPAAPGIAGALGELPLDQRSVLLLVTVEDLSYDETARVVGAPVDTVMALLSRARQTLWRIAGDGATAAPRRVG